MAESSSQECILTGGEGSWLGLLGLLWASEIQDQQYGSPKEGWISPTGQVSTPHPKNFPGSANNLLLKIPCKKWSGQRGLDTCVSLPFYLQPSFRGERHLLEPLAVFYQFPTPLFPVRSLSNSEGDSLAKGSVPPQIQFNSLPQTFFEYLLCVHWV